MARQPLTGSSGKQVVARSEAGEPKRSTWFAASFIRQEAATRRWSVCRWQVLSVTTCASSPKVLYYVRSVLLACRGQWLRLRTGHTFETLAEHVGAQEVALFGAEFVRV